METGSSPVGSTKQINMTTLFALYIWTVVGVGESRVSSLVKYDWRYSGEYKTLAHCERARTALGLKPEVARCIDTGK